MLSEVRVTRYQQIDPTTAVGLLSYFRLGAGLPALRNFAEMNPNYTFEGTNARFQFCQWQPDFVTKTHIVYDEESLSMVDVNTYHYHNSCPLYTYLKDNECYAEPINKGRLSIFPKWNQTSSQLDWIFTLEHSSMITKDVIE